MSCFDGSIQVLCSTQVICPKCCNENIKNAGYSSHNVPRYRCCNDECETKTFMLKYRYKAYEPGIKEQVVNMAINGSGVRYTLKEKESGLAQVNPNIQKIDLK